MWSGDAGSGKFMLLNALCGDAGSGKFTLLIVLWGGGEGCGMGSLPK